MDDYQTYLNALQSSNYVTQLNQFRYQIEESKKEAEKSTGDLLTTEGLREAGVKVVNAIKSKIADTATEALSKAQDTVKEAVSNVVENAKETASSVVEGVKKVVEPTEEPQLQGPTMTAEQGGDIELQDLSPPSQEEALQMLSSQSRIAPTTEDLPEGAGMIESLPTSGTIQSATETASSAFESVSDSASSAVSSLIKTASSGLSDAESAVTGIINSSGDAVDSAVSGISNAVQGAIGAGSDAVESAVGAGAEALSAGAEAISGAVGASVEALGATIGSTITGALSELGPIGLVLGTIGGGLAELIEGSKSHISQAPILNPSFQFL